METTPTTDPVATTDTRYQQARKRVEEIKGFYTHFIIYLVVNAFLFAIDLIDGGGWWFFWPLLGWGIAVAIHGAVTFGVEGSLGKRWEDRKIRELLDEDQRAHSA